MMPAKKVVLQEEGFPSQCTGCRMCELICSFTHYKTFNPSLSRIRVAKCEPDLIDYPVICRQCCNPPCRKACPSAAINPDIQTGASRIDPELCIGCGECVSACPFGAIYIPVGEKLPICCDLCDGDPQCVAYCPFKVLKYMSSEDLAKDKRQKTALKDAPQPKENVQPDN
jgi:Fe-S-cluster-containing hydrogenase component 2